MADVTDQTTNWTPTLPDPPAAPTASGTGESQIVQYVSDPVSEALTPADVGLPAIAVKADGTGPIYNWNTTTHVWNP